jgi:hypothetical protein
MRNLAYLIIFLCLGALARAGTVDVTYNFSDFTGYPLNVSRVTITPLARDAYYSGTNLSTKPIIYTKTAYPTLTNGTFTATNLISGYAYRVEISDSYQVSTITNYFGTNVTGSVDATDYLAAVFGLEQGVLTRVFYEAATATAGSATNVFFLGSSNVTWTTSGGSNVATVTGQVPRANYATYASYVTNNFYYVDKTNGVNATTSGSVTTPFKDIGYAASNTPPKATLNITNGVYVETLSRIWGEKIYNFSAGAIVTGATNANGTAQAVSGDTVNSAAANWPMIIRGRGTFVSRGSGVVQIDNGRLEMEAQKIKNYGAGVAIDIQGDNADGDDPRAHVVIRNTRIIGQVWPDTYSWMEAGCTIELIACSIITTNTQPFDFNTFLDDTDPKYLYIVLNGVESRCAQTNTVSSAGYGPRFFGELHIDPNLSE